MPESNELLLKKLDEIEARYMQIETEISSPQVASDSAKIIALSKEQGKLKPVVTKYREYKKLAENIEQANHILADE